jgi:hypothetical protein
MKTNSIIIKLDKCVSRITEINRDQKLLEFVRSHAHQTFSRSEFIKEIEFCGDIYDELVRRNILTVGKNLKTTFGSPATRYVFDNLHEYKKV